MVHLLFRTMLSIIPLLVRSFHINSPKHYRAQHFGVTAFGASTDLSVCVDKKNQKTLSLPSDLIRNDYVIYAERIRPKNSLNDSLSPLTIQTITSRLEPNYVPIHTSQFFDLAVGGLWKLIYSNSTVLSSEENL